MSAIVLLYPRAGINISFARFITRADMAPDLTTSKGFENVYRAYWKRLFGICYHQIRDEELAKELVQNIFKSLWERRDRLEITGSLENYLTRAAKLEVMSYFRTKASHERHLKCVMEETCIAQRCTEHEVEYNDLRQQVSILVDSLPCHCRQVYRLSRERGLKNKEIASALLISEKAVEYHITRALSFLKDNLREFKV